MNGSSHQPRLVPLVASTMASQGLLVVLAPTIVAIGADLGTSLGPVGQARSITAGTAIVTSVVIARRIDAVVFRACSAWAEG